MNSAVNKTLRSHYAKFEKCSDCDVVLGELYAKQFVNDFRLEQLNQENNRIMKNRYSYITIKISRFAVSSLRDTHVIFRDVTWTLGYKVCDGDVPMDNCTHQHVHGEP